MLKRSFTRLYWRIGDVSEITGIEQQTLRNWQDEYRQLRPGRDASGVRVYRERDLRIVLLLRQLLVDEECSTDEVHDVLDGDREGLNELLSGVSLDEFTEKPDEDTVSNDAAEDDESSGDESGDADDSDEDADDLDDDDEYDDAEEWDGEPGEPLPELLLDEPIDVRPPVPAPAIPWRRVPVVEPTVSAAVTPSWEPSTDVRFALRYVTPGPEPAHVADSPSEPVDERFSLPFVAQVPEQAAVHVAPLVPAVSTDPRFALSFIVARGANEPAGVPTAPVAIEAQESVVDAPAVNPRFALRFVTEREPPQRKGGGLPALKADEPTGVLPAAIAVTEPGPADDAVLLSTPEYEPGDARFALPFVVPRPESVGDEDEQGGDVAAYDAHFALPFVVARPDAVDDVDEPGDDLELAYDARFALPFVVTRDDDGPSEVEPDALQVEPNVRFALAYVTAPESDEPADIEEPAPERDIRFALAFVAGERPGSGPIRVALPHLGVEEPRSLLPAEERIAASEPHVQREALPRIRAEEPTSVRSAQARQAQSEQPRVEHPRLPGLDAAEPSDVRPVQSSRIQSTSPTVEYSALPMLSIDEPATVRPVQSQTTPPELPEADRPALPRLEAQEPSGILPAAQAGAPPEVRSLPSWAEDELRGLRGDLVSLMESLQEVATPGAAEEAVTDSSAPLPDEAQAESGPVEIEQPGETSTPRGRIRVNGAPLATRARGASGYPRRSTARRRLLVRRFR